MTVVPDEIDSGIHTIVFDEQENERPSWKLFGYNVPRSEVIFFFQIFIVMIMIVFSCIMLVITEACEDKNIYTAILSVSVGFIIPNPKL